MTRVLYWNISNFAQFKIHDTRSRAAVTWSDEALDYIMDVIDAVTPDIFVIVEVCTGLAAPGTLATGAGPAGCATLLARLQADYAPADWRLVPPLVVGTLGPEGVAVFYSGVTAAGGERVFTGPNWWSGALGRSIPPLAGGAAGAYPGAAAGWLGPARAVPANGVNVGMFENTLAPCISFQEPAAGPVGPGGGRVLAPSNFGVYREPYLCTFSETAAVAGPATRNISLFAVHTKPKSPVAAATMQTLGRTIQITDPLAAAPADIRVIVGDFNLNLLNPDGTDALAAPVGAATQRAYAPFIAAGYTPLLRMPGPPPAAGANLRAYKGYATTHIKAARQGKKQIARFMSTNASPLNYPGLGYAGATTRPNLYSIDNIMVRQNPPVPNRRLTVLNGAVGMPYLNPLGLAGVPFTGAGPLPLNPSLVPPPVVAPLATAFPWSASNPAPGLNNTTVGTNNILVSWAKYGRIYWTSDHFAMSADV